MNHIKSVLFLLLIAHITHAEIDNQTLYNRHRPDSTRVKGLYLTFENFNFFRNYEFGNNLQDGYTLFGTQIKPQLLYYPSKELVVYGGILAHKDYGKSDFSKILPLFSITYQKERSILIAGNLEGVLEHRFLEPLFDVEHRITNPIQYGIQYLFNRTYITTDSWITWEKFAEKYTNKKEQISGGLTANIKLITRPNFTFLMPFQFLAFHQGGQIDTLNTNIKTYFNTSIGLKSIINFNNSTLKNLELSANYLHFNDHSNTHELPFHNGNAIYCSGMFNVEFGTIGISYFSSQNFYSPKGMPIFQSLSSKIFMDGQTVNGKTYPWFYQKNRNLVLVRYAYQKEFAKDFYFDIRVEPFWDLNNNAKFEFYHSLFITYKTDLQLMRKQ